MRQIENYRQRISGPLLDRIDLQVEVPLVEFRELSSTTGGGESSATIRARVDAARMIQSESFRKFSNATNSPWIAQSRMYLRQFAAKHTRSGTPKSIGLEGRIKELGAGDLQVGQRPLRIPVPPSLHARQPQGVLS